MTCTLLSYGSNESMMHLMCSFECSFSGATGTLWEPREPSSEIKDMWKQLVCYPKWTPLLVANLIWEITMPKKAFKTKMVTQIPRKAENTERWVSDGNGGGKYSNLWGGLWSSWWLATAEKQCHLSLPHWLPSAFQISSENVYFFSLAPFVPLPHFPI